MEHGYIISESKQSHLFMCFDYGRLFKVSNASEQPPCILF